MDRLTSWPVHEAIDLEMLARGVRMLGLLPNEHPNAATFNDALGLAANYLRSFIGREEYLPKCIWPALGATPTADSAEIQSHGEGRKIGRATTETVLSEGLIIVAPREDEQDQ